MPLAREPIIMHKFIVISILLNAALVSANPFKKVLNLIPSLPHGGQAQEVTVSLPRDVNVRETIFRPQENKLYVFSDTGVIYTLLFDGKIWTDQYFHPVRLPDDLIRDPIDLSISEVRMVLSSRSFVPGFTYVRMFFHPTQQVEKVQLIKGKVTFEVIGVRLWAVVEDVISKKKTAYRIDFDPKKPLLDPQTALAGGPPQLKKPLAQRCSARIAKIIDWFAGL